MDRTGGPPNQLLVLTTSQQMTDDDDDDDDEICFYSCLLSYYMLINVDYTITYFLPIPSTVPRTRARSELLNVSLVPPRVEFYTALPVSIVGCY